MTDDPVLSHCIFQFAVRMPNGVLYGEPLPKQSTNDPFGMEAYFGSIFGNWFPTPASHESVPARSVAKIFDTKSEADELLKVLQDKAALVGVPHWGGAVVARLCTPFTSGDPSAEFAHAVLVWVAEQQVK